MIVYILYLMSFIDYKKHSLLTSFSESKPVNTRIPTATDSLLRACSLIIMTPSATFSSLFTSFLVDVEQGCESASSLLKFKNKQSLKLKENLSISVLISTKCSFNVPCSQCWGLVVTYLGGKEGMEPYSTWEICNLNIHPVPWSILECHGAVILGIKSVILIFLLKR